MNLIDLDIGYSSSKIFFNGKFYKVPTAISYANDCGIEYGESSIYEFEGEKYYVGEQATDESFTTTDYNFLYKFGPLITYHIFKKLGISGDISLNTGLALNDWSKRQEFKERLDFLKVNSETVSTNVKVVGPQGSGAYNSYIYQNGLPENHPASLCVVDIGYRTINFLYYEKGVANQTKMKGFPGHGIVSIMKTFSNYLESTYNMPFSEQEALSIFMNRTFSLGGITQENIPGVVEDLKRKFVQKLRNSVLVSEKKLLMMSEKVLISGGGAYYIQGVDMPQNTVFNEAPYEFANVFGYSLIR